MTRQINGFVVSDFRNDKWVITGVFSKNMPIESVKAWAKDNSLITIIFSAEIIKKLYCTSILPKRYWPKD